MFVMHPLSSTAKCYLTKILLFFDLSTLNTEIHQNTSPVIFFSKFKAFFSNFQMVSAPGQNLRDIRYISALCEAPLRVTAELNEMVQYSFVESYSIFVNT